MGSNRPPHSFEDCEPAFTTDPCPEPETPPEAVSLGGLEPFAYLLHPPNDAWLDVRGSA